MTNKKLNNINDDVSQIGNIQFEGNIIPIEWFQHIKCNSGKTDTISIMILADIVYWYRPTTIRDEFSGRILGYKKKFKSDLLQKSYKDLSDLFGLTKDQIKKSLQRLEQLNLIKRVFRNIKCNGSSLANVMFIQIFPTNIKRITEKKSDVGINPHTTEQIYPEVRVNKPTPPGNNTHTYTETTTKITTNNSLSNTFKDNSKEPKLNSLNSNEEYEREKEMINIWNKIIREGEKPSVQNKTRLLALRKVLKESFENSLENWESYCLNIKKSNFLMGGGVNNWKADLTWAIRQDNLIRVIEGYYHQKKEKEDNPNTSGAILEEKEIISNDPIWNRVKELLKSKKGEAIYKSWIRKLSFKGYKNEKVLLIAPTKFIKDWIINHFKDDIISSFKETESNIKDLEIFIKDGEGVIA